MIEFTWNIGRQVVDSLHVFCDFRIERDTEILCLHSCLFALPVENDYKTKYTCLSSSLQVKNEIYTVHQRILVTLI